jgi:hypothetical protein
LRYNKMDGEKFKFIYVSLKLSLISNDDGYLRLERYCIQQNIDLISTSDISDISYVGYVCVCINKNRYCNIIPLISSQNDIVIKFKSLGSNKIQYDSNGYQFIFCHTSQITDEALNRNEPFIFQNVTTKFSNVEEIQGLVNKIVFTSSPSHILNQIENYTIVNRQLPTSYPKIYVLIHVTQVSFLKILDYPKELLTVQTYDVFKGIDVKAFVESNSEYYFHIAPDCVLTASMLLKDLLSYSKKIISPMIHIKGKVWSNFWGSLSNIGFYDKSFDYYKILNRDIKGLWNVPYIYGVYLMHQSVIEMIPNLYSEPEDMDLDMRFCHQLRSHNVFMYIMNIKEYGYMEENVSIFDLFDSRSIWEERYLHPNFRDFILGKEDLDIKELCGDVFQFPLFTKEFCDEIVESSESYGKWSKGGQAYLDERIGSYENYPTKDIQLSELGYDKHWEEIVDSYISKVVKLVYSNYKTKGVNLSFVVRYKWDEQKDLEPHHDSSVYTMNVALNRSEIDYFGGGCHFIRQEYIVKNLKQGFCVIHPGRLTHYHEGLETTDGIRYILISFNN